MKAFFIVAVLFGFFLYKIQLELGNLSLSWIQKNHTLQIITHRQFTNRK